MVIVIMMLKVGTVARTPWTMRAEDGNVSFLILLLSTLLSREALKVTLVTTDCVRGAGGVISDLKFFVANLVLVQPVCHEFLNFRISEKGAGGNHSKFSGNSSILEKTGFPLVMVS